MKKSKLDNMPMEEIIEKAGCFIEENDIVDLTTDYNVMKEFMQLYEDETKTQQDIKEFFVRNQDSIDKKRFVFKLVWNNGRNIKRLENKHAKINGNDMSVMTKVPEYNMSIQHGKAAAKLLKGEETYLYNADIDSKGIIQKINVVSSRSVVEDISDKNLKQDKRCKNIDAHGEDNNGLAYVIQYVSMRDFEDVICKDRLLGTYLKDAMLENVILKNGKLTDEELQKLRKENSNKYFQVLSSTTRAEKANEMSETVKKHSPYMNIDFLLLDAAYRMEEHLEKAISSSDSIKACKEYAKEILDNLPNHNVALKATLHDLDAEEPIEVNYTYGDVEKVYHRIQEDKYFAKKKVEQTRQQILEGEYDLGALSKPLYAALHLNNDELKQAMLHSNENFEYVVAKLGMSGNQVVRKLMEMKVKPDNELIRWLYETEKIQNADVMKLIEQKVIDTATITAISQVEKAKELVTDDRLVEGYFTTKATQEEKVQQKFKQELEMYKALHQNQQNEQERADRENQLVEKILNISDDEKDLIFFYNNGLIPLDKVATWVNNEHMIEALEYNEMVDYISNGALEENQIIHLYMEGKIFDKDLEAIAMKGRITPARYLQATTARTKEILEENSNIKLELPQNQEIELMNIPHNKIRGITIKEETEIEGTDPYYYYGDQKQKTLIDPSARYQYLELLGAIEANAYIPDEDNAFYNYEFFVIPDADGQLQSNSVVIAERFFKDKEDQLKGLAEDNATYFFQYKDLMVNSNLSKKEMTKERDQIVSTANHRVGSWAVSVLYRIAQTTLSSNLKEYAKGDKRATVVVDELMKLYSPEQLNKILAMAEEIDDDQKHLIVEDKQTTKENADDFEDR